MDQIHSHLKVEHDGIKLELGLKQKVAIISPMTSPNINERSLKLLKILVERYIREGQPVGSKCLAQDLVLSSATVRNVMADLEQAGYIHSPHTSAGRIPTDSGYRLFVDNMLTSKPLTEEIIRQYQEQLNPKQGANVLVQNASNMLSSFTELAGVVTTPHKNKTQLNQVEFLPLSGKRILAVLVFNKKEVQNRILYTDREYSKQELERASNFVNQHCLGKDLVNARKCLLELLQEDKSTMDKMMQDALTVADQAFDDEGEAEDYVLAGESNLLKLAEAAGIDRLRNLFDAFTQKQKILHLLDKSLQADGVQIFIGKESGYDALDDWSVVTAPYEHDGEIVGVLGVIGPTRMAYDRVISTVDVTARLLSAALSEK